MDKFTIKSQEAIQEAQRLAERKGNQRLMLSTSCGHLLRMKKVLLLRYSKGSGLIQRFFRGMLKR
jgi:hypothetical protein